MNIGSNIAACDDSPWARKPRGFSGNVRPLKAPSEPKNVLGSIMIAIEHHTADRARMRTFAEILVRPFLVAGAASRSLCSQERDARL
jgi:hypothetical protein